MRGTATGTLTGERTFATFGSFHDQHLDMDDVDVLPTAEPLAGQAECDVAVIGSGIAGISTAYELCKRGKLVIVIDRGRIAGGMTSRTSAHLAPLCDDLV